MASFRGHIGAGLLVGVVVTGIFVLKSIVTGFAVPSALFIAIVIGSFMPDLDSDTSIVFSIVYSLFTSVVLAVTGYLTFQAFGPDIKTIAINVAMALVVTWLVVRPLFMSITVHRGMFHSIPAALVAGLLGYHAVLYFGGDITIAIWFGIGFTVGYITHLVLDELYSGVNFLGNPFKPSKSIGTALKFYDRDNGANTFTYLLLIVLVGAVLFR